MTPHPRIRKTVKWGGVVVTALLVVVWIGSAWWCLAWGDGANVQCTVHAGKVNVMRFSGKGASNVPKGLFLGRMQFPFKWWFALRRGRVLEYVDIPLWFPAAVAIAFTGVAWRLDILARRRSTLNLCPKCNYDRTGLAAGAVCPECGQASTPA